MTENVASFLLWSGRYTYAMKAPLADNPVCVLMISAILEGDRITHCGAPSYQSSSGHVISHLAHRSSMIAWLVLRGEKNRENPIFLDNWKCVGPNIIFTIILYYSYFPSSSYLPVT